MYVSESVCSFIYKSKSKFTTVVEGNPMAPY